ncbi:hypothetical protein AB1Y20_009758 [Prymnesium parvum]|uniref:Uncharacterized protein n=1 Tax=Prymnesium parvum TaxID=97485 RepID=A0AB34K301_PRYPA
MLLPCITLPTLAVLSTRHLGSLVSPLNHEFYHAAAGVPCRCSAPVAVQEAYRVESPCSPASAALVAGEVAIASEPSDEDEANPPPYWVAVLPTSDGAPLVQVGKPTAVGRLQVISKRKAILDRLCSSIPKEKASAAEAIEHAIDALLLAWLRRIESTEASFEDLFASATPFTAPLLEKRGFAEVEKPDFTALGRGEPIATHQARLPAACVAFSYLISQADGLSPTTLASMQSILDALRQQPPPAQAAGRSANDDGSGAEADA